MTQNPSFVALAIDMQVRNLQVTGTLSTATSLNGNRFAFIYTATGLEGASFVVAFGATRANTNYVARASGGGMANQLTFDCPQSQYQVDRCRIDCSAAPQAGDLIVITVEDMTS